MHVGDHEKKGEEGKRKKKKEKKEKENIGIGNFQNITMLLEPQVFWGWRNQGSLFLKKE